MNSLFSPRGIYSFIAFTVALFKHISVDYSTKREKYVFTGNHLQLTVI